MFSLILCFQQNPNLFWQHGLTRLWAIVPLNDHEVGWTRIGQMLHGSLVFGRLVARERLRVALEFNDHIVFARRATCHFASRTAHDKASAKLGKGNAVQAPVAIVGVRIVHINAGDPVAL